jgi:hypothetical protein
MTHKPVSRWLNMVAQPMTLPFSHKPLGLGQPSIRNVQLKEPPQTLVYQPTLTNSVCGAGSGNSQSAASCRRSRSTSGYGPLPRTGEHESIYRPIDQSIRLPMFDGYGNLRLFLQRFEAVAGHCKWPPEELLF